MESIVKKYLSTISDIPVICHEDLVNEFKKLEKLNESSHECENEEEKKRINKKISMIKSFIVKSNLKLVVSEAKKYKTSDDLPLMDLIQEGNFGLMKAVDRYNYELGNRFSTYAIHWIRQAISIHIAKNKRTVRLPSHVIGVQRRIMSAIEERNETTGETPTLDELKEILSDVSETILEATLHAGMGTVSINGTSNRNDESEFTQTSLENKLHKVGDDPFDLFSNAELFKTILQVMNNLSEREIAIIRMRFGLYDAGVIREDYIEE